ncbi:Phosphoribulokinase/uridine kinase [Penicillium sp. DV-2018c]|nr:Phosphoribulokinase/uridine kinase [Penicillium sp. DV-2018c]KAJ5570882.1 Phosphoribulokinase/uridine kinase [Penicillium sp. DV-2018c]
MDQQVTRLVNKIWVKYCSTPDDARIMVAISGIPGSGKTGLATMMAARINKIHASENPTNPALRPIAIAIPMDGYHLTRAQLAVMPDPVYAAERRGAAFTFDGEKFLSLVQDLRQPIDKRTVNLYAPSFDHAIKDPVDGDIVIPPDCRVVFFEGNYLSLNREPWSTAAALMDELWFVDVDFEVARKRLVLRHVKAGIAKDQEEADKRARENDLVNGKEIVDGRLPVQEVISSIYDPIWEKS